MANHLVNESSPYLRQHAHNPVDWYPWGEEALLKAKREDKPILVSIGYAACHWCHVMERESFEDADTASLMNEHFVNIKIDREERPDLDHIYMDAVQAISGSGGWPLNVFLTPDKKPFYGGTYYPPSPIPNRSSWKEVLTAISQAFRERRQEIEEQADNLLSHISATSNFGIGEGNTDAVFEPDLANDMFNSIMNTADRTHGGFGRAPKFPQTFTIRFLLQYAFFTDSEAAIRQACLSLDKMIDGGINDQLGGGFARYSTDEKWLVPHFEKMLYDNALLVMAMSEALQLTGKDKYRRAIERTLDFVERELMSPEGAFYSALDADSEGEEGKFYVWSKKEIDEILGNESGQFCKYYNVTENGNWEGTNILHVTSAGDEPDGARLLLARQQRVRPMTDDKILLSWNAMMTTAFCKAYAATGKEKYRLMAVRNMAWLLANFENDDGSFRHSLNQPAFLDDYAELIHALIHLQEITADQEYLEKVKTLVKWCIDHFSDDETGYFYFTNVQQKDVVVRKKELYDGAVASGNSLMAWNLCYTGIVFDDGVWKERALKMCSGVAEMVRKYPGSFGVWAITIQALAKGIPEIAVTGGDYGTVLKQLLRTFIPFRVLQSSPVEAKRFPLLAGKSYSAEATMYLCRNYSCQTPVNEVDAFRDMVVEMLKK